MNGSEQIVEQMAWNGRFPPAVLISVGIAVAIAVIVLTWMGSRSARRLFPLFVVLRLVAVGVLVWMLAEPVIRTTVSRTRSKSIVVMADGSASMGVTDPALDDVQAVRWAAVDESAGQAAMMLNVDGARYALTAARDHLGRLSSQVGDKPDWQAAKRVLADAAKWVQVADQELKQVPNQAVDVGRSAVEGFLGSKLTELQDDVAAGRIDLTDGAGGPVGELRRSLDETIAELDRAADRVATELSKTTDAYARSVVQRQAATSRREKVAGLLGRVEASEFKKLAEQGTILRYRFDRQVLATDGTTWAPPTPDPADTAQAQTDLSAAIEQAQTDANDRLIEAVFLLTDGGHNANDDPVKRLSGHDDIPIYVVPVGSTKPARDVALHHVQAPRSVMQNDLVRIEAMLDAYECAGESLSVQLMQAGKLIDQQTVTVPTDNYFVPLKFERKAEQLGTQEYILTVRQLPDERVQDNNDAKLTVEVTENTVRVLLVDHLPRWEFRYLRNLFKRDERVEFNSILVQPQQTEGTGAGSVPSRADDWGRYHVVILGDLPPDVLTNERQQQLEEYVSTRGGTLVLIAGSEAMPEAYLNSPLGPMLPVEPIRHAVGGREGVQIVPTAEGGSAEPIQIADEPDGSGQVWTALPAVYDLSEYCLPRQTSHVWLSAVPNASRGQSGQDAAFLCWHQVGRGRVVYMAAPDTYRLRMRHGDRYHYRFWGQLLRWAMARDLGTGSNLVRLITDKLQYQPGEAVQVMVRLSDRQGEPVRGAGIAATVHREDQPVATVPLVEDENTPGEYRAAVRDLPIGKLTIGVTGEGIDALAPKRSGEKPIETQITMEPPLSIELRDTRCNLSLLNKIAAASRGAVVPPTALPTVVSGLDLSPEVTREIRTTPVWPQWRYLAILIGSLCLEWAVRKLSGLA
ncbi:MAG: hypothetical protein HY718_06425 [Planctomycetes bacterium]|nr:hypothetical protein [Planctomycetota bacterium]